MSAPSSLRFNTASTQKSRSLAHGAVTKDLQGKDDIDAPCGGRPTTSQSTWTPRLFLLTKTNCSKSAQRKRKFAEFVEETFIKCINSAPRPKFATNRESDRHRSKQNLQSSGPTLFSVCATVLSLEMRKNRKRKEKGVKLVKCRTADKTKKKVAGSQHKYKRMMSDPRSRSMICRHAWFAKLRKK